MKTDVVPLTVLASEPLTDLVGSATSSKQKTRCCFSES